MGGEIKVGTKTKVRLSIGRKIFKDVFYERKIKMSNINAEFIGVVNDNESLFKFENNGSTIYILFYKNIALSYGESEDYYV